MQPFHRDIVRPTSHLAWTTWPLTPTDRFASRWVIQGTWVFDRRIDADTLKRGLVRLLDSYSILSGRMVGPRIVSLKSGVPVIETTDTGLSVRDFGPGSIDVGRFGDRRNPVLIQLGLAPLLTVKLTHIRDGCVLGVCASHACLDGQGFYAMVRNLGRATRGEPFAPPVFDRVPAAPPRRGSAVARAARAAGWHRVTVRDAVRLLLPPPRAGGRAFVSHFSPEALGRCKEAMVRESGCERLSTNSALVAHVADCARTLLRVDAASSFAVSMTVDQRGRVPDVPEHFAGNAVSLVTAGPISAGAPAGEIAARLHERLAPLLARPSADLAALATLAREVAAHRLPYTPLPGTPLFGRPTPLFYTNSFSKFPVYDLDFGGASQPVRPVRAIPHNLGDPIVLWPAPPSTGGLDLYFSGRLEQALTTGGHDQAWQTALRRFGD